MPCESTFKGLGKRVKVKKFIGMEEPKRTTQRWHSSIRVERRDTTWWGRISQRMKILQGRLLRLDRESDLPQLYRLAFSGFFRALDALPCSTIHPKEQLRVSTSYTLLAGFVVEGETTLYHQTESVERVEWRIAPCSDGLELTACYSCLLEYQLAVEAALAGLWC